MVDLDSAKELERAKAIAYRLLSFRSRSTSEIIRKLKTKGIDPQIIEQTIAVLSEYNYLNDDKFARLWVENRNLLKPMGKRRLQQELAEKGVATHIIGQVLSGIAGEDEETLVKNLVEKKLARNQELNLKKLENFLLRRGFSPMVIRKVLGNRMEIPPELV